MTRRLTDRDVRESNHDSIILPPSKVRTGKRLKRLSSKEAQENGKESGNTCHKGYAKRDPKSPVSGPAAASSHSSSYEIIRPQTSSRAPSRSKQKPRRGMCRQNAASRCPSSCHKAAKRIASPTPLRSLSTIHKRNKSAVKRIDSFFFFISSPPVFLSTL